MRCIRYLSVLVAVLLLAAYAEASSVPEGYEVIPAKLVPMI